MTKKVQPGFQRVERISLFGNFGSLNIGNECTLQALLFNIRRYLPHADVNCICSCPADVEARHGVPAIPMSERSCSVTTAPSRERERFILRRILRVCFVRCPAELRALIKTWVALRNRDMLIMTGTGMLADHGEGAFGLPYEIFKWVAAAKLRGIKVLFLCVGVEMMENKLTRWFVKSALRVADYICYRDDQSRRSMAEIGFLKRSSVYPDLAFSLPQKPGPAPPRGGEKPVIGVGLYDYRGRGVGAGDHSFHYLNYIEKLCRLVTLLTDKGHPVRILIGDIRYDSPVREDLSKALESRGVIYKKRGILDEPISSVDDLFAQIGSTDIVIATRFHNVLISLMLNKPVISVSYNEKNDSLMAEAGLAEFCMHVDDFDVDLLIGKLNVIKEIAAQIKPLIEKRTEVFRRALDEQYRMIFLAPPR